MRTWWQKRILLNIWSRREQRGLYVGPPFQWSIKKKFEIPNCEFQQIFGPHAHSNFQFLAVHTSHTHVHFAKIPIAQGHVLLCMCSFPKCTNTPLLYISKGQLISIRLFCFFNSSKKQTKNFCTSWLGQKLTLVSNLKTKYLSYYLLVNVKVKAIDFSMSVSKNMLS